MKRRTSGMRRRDLAGALTLAAPAVAMAAQQAPAAAEDLEALAREQAKRASDTLRKFKVPIATEPSFAFRP